MGQVSSKLKKKGSKFQLPDEDKNTTEAEFQCGISKTLPKEWLENKDCETLSSRGSEYAISENSNEDLRLRKEKHVLENKTNVHQGLTQYNGLETIYGDQERNTEDHTNGAFVPLSCNTTPDTYPADAEIVAPLYGDYPKSQNPIHVLYGTQVKTVARAMDDVGYEDGRVYMDDVGYEDVRDIRPFSYNMEVDRSEALVK